MTEKDKSLQTILTNNNSAIFYGLLAKDKPAVQVLENPKYSLFCPTDEAILKFMNSVGYNKFSEADFKQAIDPVTVENLVRYHIVPTQKTFATGLTREMILSQTRQTFSICPTYDSVEGTPLFFSSESSNGGIQKLYVNNAEISNNVKSYGRQSRILFIDNVLIPKTLDSIDLRSVGCKAKKKGIVAARATKQKAKDAGNYVVKKIKK